MEEFAKVYYFISGLTFELCRDGKAPWWFLFIVLAMVSLLELGAYIDKHREHK